jgi:cation diffusion facilitator CzcD-associated flavoprotein CzcO
MPSAEQLPYLVQDVALGSHRPIRVVCIGVGYSGLMMSIIAKEKMQHHNVDFQVYEMNNDLGGTWLVNR